MRILYLSQYFPPEIGATQTRAYEMAVGLVRNGHQVTIVAEVPNHPHGVVQSEYRGKLYDRRSVDGIDVIRVWVWTSPVKSFRRRMAFYLSFMVMAALSGLLLARGKYDAVYATSPPLFVGGAALFISYLRRIPLIFEVRDLWPESAIQLGELVGNRAVRLATWLEETCYCHAAHIVVATQGIRMHLLERGYEPSRITVIPNGANTELYRPLPPDSNLRRDLGLQDEKFLILYTGLHGLAHGLESALRAADRLRGATDIAFLFVGDGPEKITLKQTAANMALPNVIFHDAVAEKQLPAILALGNVGLDTRRRIGISRGTLPVKMFSYMACELPVLLAIEGEAVTLLEEAKAGIAVPPDDPEALAGAILKLRANPDLCRYFGRQGRAFVELNFSRQHFAIQLEELLYATIRC